MGAISSCCCECCDKDKDEDKSKGEKGNRRKRGKRSRSPPARRRKREDKSEVEQKPATEKARVKIAIAPYEPGSTAEVKLEKGDRVEVLEKEQGDFVFIKQLKMDMDGARGYVASNFLADEGSMDAEDFYFGPIRRRDAQTTLQNEALPIGTYLVRDCETGCNTALTTKAEFLAKYVLSVKDAKKIHHYRIYIKTDPQQPGTKKYCMGGASDFDTIGDLIEYYRKHANTTELPHELTLPAIRPPPVRKELAKGLEQRWREIPKDQLAVGDVIGEGKFGKVSKAKWSMVGGGQAIDVAVKELKGVTMKVKHLLLDEATAMRDLCHPNVVRLYGVVSRQEPYYIVTEYVNCKSLRDHLQWRRSLHLPALESDVLSDIACQIARGMEYVASKGVVHRDLSARNVLAEMVTEKPPSYKAKITDFGLARILYEAEIYKPKVGGDTMLPMQWLAPEAYNKLQYSTKSDVWAFGATLCELFSEGNNPFPASVDGPKLLRYVKRGKPPQPPPAMPDYVRKIYDDSTRLNPKHRATFDEIVDKFERHFHKDDDTSVQ